MKPITKPKTGSDIYEAGGNRVRRVWLEESRTCGPRAKWRRVKDDTPRLRYLRFNVEMERPPKTTVTIKTRPIKTRKLP